MDATLRSMLRPGERVRVFLGYGNKGLLPPYHSESSAMIRRS